MMDDVLPAGMRELAAKPADWRIVDAPRSPSKAGGFMLRRDDPSFKALVDGVLV